MQHWNEVIEGGVKFKIEKAVQESSCILIKLSWIGSKRRYWHSKSIISQRQENNY